MNPYALRPLPVALLLGTLLASAEAGAVVPPTLTDQGRLFDADGMPISDTLDVTFTIYDAPVDGTAIWTETHSITFDEGYYSVELGETTAFDSTVIDGSTRYIGISVAGDDEMTPRGVVGSVPYAMLANDVNGDINPTSVNIQGVGPVIDSNGLWVGDTAGFAGAQGPQGPQGPQGSDGATGPQGAVGASGPQGVAGVAGPQGAMGPQGFDGAVGAVGAVGPVGPQGPQGAQGAQGPQGSQGPAGTAGATGPQGAVGPQGVVGPQGSTGIIATAYIQAVVPAFADSVGVWAFLGPTVSVNATATTNIHVISTATLGTTAAGGAAMSRISVCHQLNPGGMLVDHLNDFSAIRITVNTRIPITVSQRITTLAVGTYNVGLCYQTTAGQAANWNDNWWINNHVFVLQG